MTMTFPTPNLHAAPRYPTLFPVAHSRWLQVLSHLDPKYGGICTTVPELGDALIRGGRCSIEFAAFCAPYEEYKPVSMAEPTLSYWPSARGTWLHNPQLRDRFHQTVLRSNGLHIHGLWEQSTAIAGSMAREARKPYVLSAHGMLERWALHKKRFKKFIYSALIERATVRSAACLHALTHAEAQDYLRFGSAGPIAVLGNGVHIPESKSPEPFLTQFPHLRNGRIVLFLGRLHPKKGVDLLLAAWARIAASWPDAHLVLAGPDVEGTRAALEQTVARNAIPQITFTGMLRDEGKWSALAAAEAFILPSHSEGLSVSVLEAMGMGLPVIVTAQCNMPQVVEHNAGWQIEPEVNQIASALRELLRNSPSVNASIGSRGSALILRQYNWTAIAERMADVYRWVEGGPIPHSVDLVYR